MQNYHQSQQSPQVLPKPLMLNNLSLTRLFSEDDSPQPKHQSLKQEVEDNFDWEPRSVFKHVSAPIISPAQITTPSSFKVQAHPQACYNRPTPIEITQQQQLANDVDSALEFLNAFGEEVSMSPLSLNQKSSLMQVSSNETDSQE